MDKEKILIPPLFDVDYILEHIDWELVKSKFHEEQYGDAQVLTHLFSNPVRRLVCVKSSKQKGDWFYWDWIDDVQTKTGVWKKDDGTLVLSTIPSILPKIYEKMLPQLPQHLWALVHSRIHQLRRVGYQKGVLEQSKSFLYDPEFMGTLDADPNLLSVANGVLDLTSGIFRPATPDDRIHIRAPTLWKGWEEPCVEWERVINEMMNGDKTLVRFIQDTIGNGLRGDNLQHIFLVFFGGTHTGKSVILNIMNGLLGGTYYKPMSRDVLIQSKFGHSEGSHTNHWVDLIGSRIATYSETTAQTKLNEESIKNVTGEDTITVRPIWGKEMQYKPGFLPLMITNFVPMLSFQDEALWTRIAIVPFRVRFSDRIDDRIDETDEDDDLDEGISTVCVKPIQRGLSTCLLANEASGILRWFMQGCIRVANEGLERPPIVQKTTQRARRALDDVDEWLYDWKRTTKCVTRANILYHDYREWCCRNHRIIQLSTMTAFGTYLAHKKRIPKNRNNKGMMYALEKI